MPERVSPKANKKAECTLGEPRSTGTRVLIADDHECVRRGLTELIKSEPKLEVCGEARDGQEAVEKARQLRPDVVVLDISMPGINGIEAARQIVQQNSEAEVLVLTMYESEQMVDEVLKAGAHGYLLKSDVGRDLLCAISSLARHIPFFTSNAATLILQGFLESSANPEPSGPAVLTARERQVVQLVAEGKSTKEVAVIQGIEVKTAETHRANVMRKLGVHSVSDVVRYAIRHKMIEA